MKKNYLLLIVLSIFISSCTKQETTDISELKNDNWATLIDLRANEIGEPAIYNWYDQNGDLIYEGIDFTTSVYFAQKYKLEVIALADGYKDYTEIEVNFKPNLIEKLFPNPLLTNQLNVDYKINEADNAYICISNYYNMNIFNNYILDVSTSSVQLDLHEYPAGIYVVTLICNGKISDSKTFVKQ